MTSTIKKAWQEFKLLARKIGDFQARLLFAALYFTLVAPFGFGVRLFGDPLRVKRHGSNWASGKSWSEGLETLRRQF